MAKLKPSPETFSAQVGGCTYRREGKKVFVTYKGCEYRGDVGTATANGVYLRVRCYHGTGQQFCEVDYDTRGQHNALGIYYDRPMETVLMGSPDVIEFFTRGPRLMFGGY